MTDLPKEERILNLVSYLLKSSEPVPWERIRGRVAGYDDAASGPALDRRFERDKKEMRGLGIPLTYVSTDSFGREGYYIDRSRYFMPEIELEIEEAMILSLACLRAAKTSGRAVKEQVSRALAKLSCVNPLLAEATEEIESAFQSLPSSAKPDAGYEANLALVSEALNTQKRVEISYSPAGKKAVRRVIRPYGLGYWTRNWYAVAWCELRKEERTFNLRKIKGKAGFATDGEEPEYDIPPDFDMKSRIGREAWEYGAPGKETEYEIHFDPSIAWLAEDYRFAGSAYSLAAGGAGVLTLPVKNEIPLFRFLAPFRGKARIAKPNAARARYREMLKRTAALYGSKLKKGGRA